ncbi:helix-turn-helix domain-containing protein [Cupriavidus metallidurans]|uniref:Transcriptional regulator Cro/CI family n=3 Tax=Cupriavidus TaxID=106589 RepID=Q1LA95_CUPMC|nr:helix-turn-helix transcriptional regulator [Cupriavidus metallidurans]ABF12931.1 putative transcriptional regulator Cro/CI family [Cupriavidus metallidurans CH34]QGS31226.1 helix-turn-helix domain-containing protein [Cupriavidus metallidurans]
MVRKNAMKRARRLARLTQSEIAKRLGLSQSTYHRWESGEIEVPEAKVISLSEALGVSVEYLRGQPEPFDIEGMDEQLPADRKNYGFAAIHFSTGCPPLLLPISDGERSRILIQLDDADTLGIVIQSLDNRTVYIRRAAMGDMYLTGHEVGEGGPEEYGDQYLGVAPDDTFWRIVSQLDSPHDLLAKAEFTEEEVLAVFTHIRPSSPALGGTPSRVEFEGLDWDAVVASVDKKI